ncbi:MAG: hypothetical protein ACD_19C00125G0001 [uncultured bacterium]|nr:MAG: hypothetical protein ACD_19C00125G0001 [uncultured bacterium]
MSLMFDSNPIWNSKITTPNSAKKLIIESFFIGSNQLIPSRAIFPKITPITNSPKTDGCPTFSIKLDILANTNITAIHKKVAAILPCPSAAPSLA